MNGAYEYFEAKRKVEEWRARNAEMNRKFLESIHYKESSFENAEDYDERTITGYIRNQQIGLAGEGTKMNIKKYGNGNFPPEPESHHFLIELSSTEVANQEGSNQSIRSAKDVQNEVVKPGTASLASNTRETSHGSRVHVSERLKLIMEERKIAGTQKCVETSKANETSQTITFPTQLNKSSVKNILSDRMRQIMVGRKNGALSAESEAKGNSVGLHSKNENMEKIPKIMNGPNVEMERIAEKFRARMAEKKRQFQESIHHKEASFDNMEEYDESTLTDYYIKNQQIGSAGEGMKMNIKKYRNGQFPPEQESNHFLFKLSSTEVANQEGSNQRIRSAKDVQNEVVKPGTASLASNTRETSHGSRVHVSERLKLIMEERKIAGTQKSVETSKANETSQTITFPTQLNKSSVKNILSDRMRQIMVGRKNGALSAESEAKGDSVGLHSNNENMEKIPKTKLEKLTLPSHNRKKGESGASIIKASKGQSKRGEMRSKPHYANKNATGGEQDKSSSPFSNIRMIPAGYDLSNLNKYKNEENHWHRKKSTLHDYVPHDDVNLLNTS